MHKFYLPRAESKRVLWLQNFSSKLPAYAVKYNISASDITDMAGCAESYAYWVDTANKLGVYSKKLNTFKREFASGTAGLLTAPLAPTLAVAPPLPPQGVFKRVSAIVNSIKGKSVYAQNDGLDLGIQASAAEMSDLSTLKPVISVRISTDGRPEIVWNKGDNDGVEIQVDKGDGTWQFLGIGLRPNYTNKSALPELGKAEVWRHRAIYIDNDQHIGQWSNVAEIAVIGLI